LICINKVVGYTTGVFDLFHIGHLNILREAKKYCDYLIVGVTTDQEAHRVKSVEPWIPFNERFQIIESIRYVDEVVPEYSTDKIKAWREIQFNIIFKGSDWKSSEEFKKYVDFFHKNEVMVKFIEYTKSTSSTQLKSRLK
jgi:glycerol-3-phosphate cytidylyltransferase